MKYIILSLMLLTGCDQLKTLKYKYYFTQKGEMLCSQGESNKKYLSKLNEAYPLVLDENKQILKLNKIYEDEKVLNMQHLSVEGYSFIYLLDKNSADLLEIKTGKRDGKIYNESSSYSCR